MGALASGLDMGQNMWFHFPLKMLLPKKCVPEVEFVMATHELHHIIE